MLEEYIEKKIDEKLEMELEKRLKPCPQLKPPTRWFTAKDFCYHYSVSRSTLQRMRRQGRVEVLDGGNRIIRYRWKEEDK